jgi:oligopeptide transport system substrate-binding protein
MNRPAITEAQAQVLAARLASVGVDRRGFLRIAAGLSAMSLGPAAAGRAVAAPPLAPGERLAAAQDLRMGGGGWYQTDPSSHDFNKDLYCGGVPALWAGLMKFTADFEAVPYLAERVTPNADGSQWVFTLRRDARWSNGTPCTASDFEWSWKRQLLPATASPWASFLYDLKNAEEYNKGRLTDAARVGVRARGQWTLEVTLEGPRGYFPVLTAYLAALPAHRPSVETHGDRWTEAANIVCNGPFVLASWDHNRVMVLRKNPYFFDAAQVTLERVTIPIVPVSSGSLPYEADEVDVTLLQPGDARRLRDSPRTARELFPFPFPGTWYLTPQVTKPPFDDLRVRRALAHAIDRVNIVRVAQDFAIPAHSMIPTGFPGALDDPRIRELQKFDPVRAMDQLRGTPFEGGRGWPRVQISLRDEGLGSKPLVEAVQAVLLEHLNMKTELDVLEARAFREKLWRQDLQLVWIRWFMDYPDPHNQYFDPFYGRKTVARRQAWRNDAFDAALEQARDTVQPAARLAHYSRAEEILQRDVGYVPVAWVQRWAAVKPRVRGLQRTRRGSWVVDGNIYVDMLPHLYVVEQGPPVKLAATPPPAPVPTPPTRTRPNPYPNSWALVIGINAYRAVNRLTYAVADARAVADALPALGFPPETTRVLLDGDATKSRIETVLYRDFGRMQPDDRLLVYFAGHGQTAPLKSGQEEGYLLPVDVDLDALPLTGIPMDEVRRIGQRVRAKHVLFVVDACFSGFLMTRDVTPSHVTDDYIAGALREPVVQVITAGRKGEQAIEEGGHGLFTRRFLEGLRGYADPEARGYITVGGLANWIEQRVVRDSRGRMTPQYGKLDGEGQFLFIPARP